MYTFLLIVGSMLAGAGLWSLWQQRHRGLENSRDAEQPLPRQTTASVEVSGSRPVRVIGTKQLDRVLGRMGLRDDGGTLLLNAPTIDPLKEGAWQQDVVILAMLQAKVWTTPEEFQMIGLIELEWEDANRLLLYAHSRLFVLPLQQLGDVDQLRLRQEFNEAVDSHEGTITDWLGRDWQVPSAQGGSWRGVTSEVTVNYLHPELGREGGPTSLLCPELNQGDTRVFRQILLLDQDNKLAYGFEVDGTWHFADVGRELDSSEVHRLETA